MSKRYETKKGQLVAVVAVEQTSKVEQVTPDLAKEWLALSVGNRGVNKQRIVDYAADMKAGRWFVTNQGIGFDHTGALIDGHHRLRAVIRADVAVSMMVTRGLNPEAKQFIDVGQKRSPGQILGMVYGIPHGNLIAACGRIFNFAHGTAYHVPSEMISAEELATTYYANRRSFDDMKAFNKLPSSVLGVLMYAYSINPGRVMDFARQVTTKIGIQESTAEAAFVRVYEKSASASNKDQDSLARLTFAAIIHKLKGSKIERLITTDTALDMVRALRKTDL